MKIGIAADHHGIKVKETIKEYLEKKGYEVIDYGTNTSDSVDYPEYAFKVAKLLKKEEIELGILILLAAIDIPIPVLQIKIPFSIFLFTTSSPILNA